jgi:hypothetical protein
MSKSMLPQGEGCKETLMSSSDRKLVVIVGSGPQAHWAKVAFEHMFIGTRKRCALAL